MRLALILATIAVAVPAQAQVSLGSYTPRRNLLQNAQGQNPVNEVKGNTFLIGLGLAAAGVVLGGAGFAILYACREGESCHEDKTINTVGWIVAAPGVIPLVIGLFLMYISTGGGKSVSSHGASAVSVGIAPLPGGGAMASGAFRF